MNKKLLLFLAVIMAMASAMSQTIFSAVAPSGQTLYYTISNGVAMVTYENTTVPRYTSLSGALVIPDSVSYNGTTYAVGKINTNAFNGCSGLTSVTIPAPITNILGLAFKNCSGLTTVNFNADSCLLMTGAGNSATFATANGCTSLTTVNIGANVKRIPNAAFSGCTGLTTITIPQAVSRIGSSAFRDCSNLTTLNFNADSCLQMNVVFPGSTPLTTVNIGSTVKHIPANAFSGVTTLTSVTIPSTVISIGNFAFRYVNHIIYYGPASGAKWGAYSMNGVVDGDFVYSDSTRTTLLRYMGSDTSVAIPSTVTNIGALAFHNCSNLALITIPNSVINIGDSAFCACGGLSSITIPNSVTGIGEGAFCDCSGLASITIGSSVASIGKKAFSNCTNLTSVTIPNSVISIGDSTFCGCSGLTSVTLGDSVASIGSSAFFGCNILATTNYTGTIAGWCGIVFNNPNANPVMHSRSLNINDILITNLVIPESVTSIGDYAFFWCDSLKTVTIPSTMTSIGYSALECNLDSVFILPTVPPTHNNGYWSLQTVLRVPCGAIPTYQSAWGYYNYCEPNAPVSFSLSANDSTLGSVSIIQRYGANVSCADSSVIIQATPNLHCHFDHWTGGSTTNRDTLYLIGDSSVTAFFALDHHTVTATTNIAGAGIIQGTGTFNYGDTTMLTVTANYGYTFTGWSDGSTDNPRTIIVDRDYTLRAVFAYQTYTVTATTVLEDTLWGETGGSKVYNYGDTAWLGAYAKMHCRFVEWGDGNTENPRMLVVASDTSFTAHFAPRDTVHEQSEPEEIHDTVVIVDTIYIRTEGEAAAPHTMSFEDSYNNIEYSPYNTGRKNGNVGGLLSYNEISFIPDGPYCPELGPCLPMGISVSGFAEEAQIQSPEDIISVCVNMEHTYMGDLEISLLCPSYSEEDSTGHGKAVLKYRAQGSIPLGVQVPDGTWFGGARMMGIPYGGSRSYDRLLGGSGCDATSNPYGIGFDYCFSRNSSRALVNGQPASTPFPDSAGLANAPMDSVTYTFPSIPEDFANAGTSCGEVAIRTLPASNRETGTGFYVPASDFTSLVGCPLNGEWQLVLCDTYGMDNGWVFNWSIDFGSSVYVYSQDTAIGNVKGYGYAYSSSQARVTAMPKAGNYFMGWSDGSEDNPYNLIILGDTTLVAYFAERDSLVIYDTVDTLYIHDTIYIHDTLYVGIASVSVLSAKVYSSNGQIVVEGAEGNTVTLYDAVGRILATKQDNDAPIRFDAPASGTYMVRIGKYPARKVVVIR